MNIFDALIDTIKEKADVNTDDQAGRVVELTPAVVAQCRAAPRTRPSWWATRFKGLWDEAYSKGLEAGRQLCVERLMQAVEESHLATTQQEKAKAFGVTQASVNHWLSGNAAPTVRSLKRMLDRRAMIRIQAMAEVEPIDPVNKGGGWWIDADTNKRQSWRTQLTPHYGVYMFLDSSRRVTYVGKADRTNLFLEIEQRLREAKLRGTHFDTALQKRTERSNPLCQGEVARFLSVYRVSDSASIHNLEVLMIRAFMNNHLNRRRERFK